VWFPTRLTGSIAAYKTHTLTHLHTNTAANLHNRARTYIPTHAHAAHIHTCVTGDTRVPLTICDIRACAGDMDAT